jgi:hypothetical protein
VALDDVLLQGVGGHQVAAEQGVGGPAEDRHGVGHVVDGDVRRHSGDGCSLRLGLDGQRDQKPAGAEAIGDVGPRDPRQHAVEADTPGPDPDQPV